MIRIEVDSIKFYVPSVDVNHVVLSELLFVDTKSFNRLRFHVAYKDGLINDMDIKSENLHEPTTVTITYDFIKRNLFVQVHSVSDLINWHGRLTLDDTIKPRVYTELDDLMKKLGFRKKRNFEAFAWKVNWVDVKFDKFVGADFTSHYIEYFKCINLSRYVKDFMKAESCWYSNKSLKTLFYDKWKETVDTTKKIDVGNEHDIEKFKKTKNQFAGALRMEVRIKAGELKRMLGKTPLFNEIYNDTFMRLVLDKQLSKIPYIHLPSGTQEDVYNAIENSGEPTKTINSHKRIADEINMDNYNYTPAMKYRHRKFFEDLGISPFYSSIPLQPLVQFLKANKNFNAALSKKEFDYPVQLNHQRNCNCFSDSAVHNPNNFCVHHQKMHSARMRKMKEFMWEQRFKGKMGRNDFKKLIKSFDNVLKR